MNKRFSQSVEATVLSPDRVGAALSVLAATGILLSRLVISWSRTEYVYLVGAALLAYSIATVRWIWWHRFPLWTLNIDIVIFTVIVSALNIVSSRHGFNALMFFPWIAIYSALYLPRRAILAHVALIGVALALVERYSSGVSDPVATWSITFATVVVIAQIVSHLVLILRRDGTQDALTRLANRRTWDDRVSEEVERARRSGAALSIAVLDIDDFKAVNDREGHQAGDALLRTFANEWREIVRVSGDFLARLGGDEFGLVAPATDETGVRRLVARLGEVAPDGVTCSVGVATWDRSETAGVLFRRADEAMYLRKRQRRSAGGSREAGTFEGLH